MNNLRLIVLLVVFVMICCVRVYAQIKILPHGYLNYQKHATNTRTTTDSSKLTLPFWEEFSTSVVFPDTSKWVNSENVNITPGTGMNPPTINVATFDGVDGYGNPHSNNDKTIGEGDSLVSRFIDLTNVDNPGSIYISFFVQKEGRGELPDKEDGIRLKFKDNNNNWTTVWDTTGTEIDNSEEFIFKILPVNKEAYHHEYFQFKFESTGRLSGAFDTWNIDYVYMNDERNADDRTFVDRAFASFPTSIFKAHTALPYDHFMTNPENYLDSSWVVIRNLNEIVQPVDYNAIIRFQGETEVLDSIRKTVGRSVEAFDTHMAGTDIIDPDLFNDLGDSLFLELEFTMDTDDSLIENTIDPRVNDTVQSQVVIHEELAYDDGTAEFSVALNAKGGKIAYEFNAPIEDEITGLKMYLPKSVAAQQSNSIILYVWETLNEEGQLYRQEAVPIHASSINEFGTYEFLRPVSIDGTFYVGYEQTIDDFFPVGLDKNGDSGDKVYFNIDGSWAPSTNVEGNLMIRPIFGDAESVVSGVGGPDEEWPVKVYPNPFINTLKIEGPVDRITIYSVHGQKVYDENLYESAVQIDGSAFTQGVYIIKVYSGNKQYERKVIKQ